MNTEVVITPAVFDSGKYFIFRQNGQEIEVKIIDGMIKSTKPLFSHESDYINKYYL